MDARRGEGDQDVARRDVPAREQAAALRGPDRKAREIVVAVGVHAGHLRRLASDKRAAGLHAAGRDALDHLVGDVARQLAAGEIVEEEQRLRALHDDVVHRHRDKVDADRVVHAGLDRDLELCPDAVIGRDQHGIREAGGLQIEQAAEPADLGVGAAPAGRAHQRLEAFDESVAGLDVDARLRVGEAAIGRLVLGHSRLDAASPAP